MGRTFEAFLVKSGSLYPKESAECAYPARAIAFGKVVQKTLDLCWAMAAIHGQPSNNFFCEKKVKKKAK